MRSKILFELKKAYEPFSVLWEEWAQSPNCLLNPDEIYTMEVHRINNFQIDISDFIMYYNRRENTLELIRKLSMKSQYRYYKDFIIMRFEVELLRLIAVNERSLSGSVPIRNLPDSYEQKTVLLKFGKATVSDIINGYTKDASRKSETFVLILNFLKLEAKKV